MQVLASVRIADASAICQRPYRTDFSDGVLHGLKLALFDISDLSSPREVASLELGGRGSESDLSMDHRALLYDPFRRCVV